MQVKRINFKVALKLMSYSNRKGYITFWDSQLPSQIFHLLYDSMKYLSHLTLFKLDHRKLHSKLGIFVQVGLIYPNKNGEEDNKRLL